LNNPLKFIDPSGEVPALAIIGAIFVSGAINVAANWGEIHGWEHGLASFGVGAASAGVSIWVSPVLGAIVAGAGNSIVNQGVNNGWSNIDIGNVAFSSCLSAVTFVAGGKISKWLEDPLEKATSCIEDEILKATVQDAISGAAGGFAVGTGLSLANGDDLGDALGIGGRQALQGTVFGGLSGLTRGYAQHEQKSKPYQNHHFATNKNKKYTPEMEEIASHYGLDLNDSWNIEKLPHVGRHPNEYHNWILNQMREIDMTPGMNQEYFIQQFEIRVKQPVRNNPDMLNKNYWKR